MIQSKVEDALAEEILAGKVNRGDCVTISYKGKQIDISVAE
jgi:ATP-dependent Clp protease ATP-binding subunit ClpA